MKLSNFSAFCILIILAAGTNALFAQKITAEDVLAKHLDSIGSAKSRNAVKTRIIVSDVEFLSRRQNPVGGKSVFASSTEGAVFGINLNVNNYRLDKFSFDGKKARVGFITPGVRSALGGFIFSYDDALKEGLLGGTLLSSWALLNIESKKTRLIYKGTEKIDKKETHVIEYLPKGGSSLTVKMYFDAENFRHVRSEYYAIIAAGAGGSVEASPGLAQSRHRLIEEFSNYKKFGELNLPSSYKINYTLTRVGATLMEVEYKFKITDASFNQSLGENAFDIDAS